MYSEVLNSVNPDIMMREFGRQKTFILILLAVLLGSSSLINLGSSEFPLDPTILRLRYLLVSTSLLLFIGISRSNKWRLDSKAVPLILVWTLFSFVLVISGLANNDSTSVRDGFWFMIGIPFIFFYTLPKLMEKSANQLIAIALLIGHVPYIVVSLCLYPITPSPYKGVFANPNQMGFTGATIAAAVFILLIAALSTKNSLLYISFLILLLTSSLIIILVANSRTSLIAFFSMFLILLFQLIYNPNYLFKFLSIITTASTAFVLLFSQQLHLIWNNIVVGVITKNENSDGISGRGEIWIDVLNNINLLGHGTEYIESHFNLGGHNTLIDVVARYGMIAGYLLLFLTITSLLYSYFYFKNYAKNDPYTIAPLVITVCFWVLSMGEGMFGSLGNAMTLAYTLSIGVILIKPNME